MFSLKDDDDDDADFIRPMSGTNLASIFGAQMSQPKEDGNVTLRYNPPKQPTVPVKDMTDSTVPPEQAAAGDAQPELQPPKRSICILAKSVVAQLFVDNAYIPKGKLGLAIVKVFSTPETIKLLLYNAQKKPLASTRLDGNATVAFQGNRYLNFYDDHRNNWSVLFSSNQDYDEFVKAYVSCNTKGEMKSTVEPEKATIKEEPKQEIETHLEQSIESLEVEADKRKEDNTKTILLNRVAKMGQAILPVKLNTSELNSDSSDTYEDERIHRDKIIHRNKHPKPPIATRKNPINRSRLDNTMDTNNQTILYADSSQAQPINSGVLNQSGSYFTMANGQLVPAGQACGDVVIPASYNYLDRSNNMDNLNMIFIENRTHNTEMRMNVSRLTDKLDKIMEKMVNIEDDSKTGPAKMIEKQCSMTTDVYQKLIGEYEKRIQNQETQIEELKDRLKAKPISDRSAVDQKINHNEEGSIKLALENASLQSKIKELEELLYKSSKELNTKSEQKEECEKRIQHLSNQVKDGEKKVDCLERLQIQVADLKNENDKLQEALVSVETKVSAKESKTAKDMEYLYNMKCRELKDTLTENKMQREKIKELCTRLESIEDGERTTKERTDFEVKIKVLMNETFENLKVHFDADECYSGDVIREIIGATIKNTTLNMLERFVS